MSEKPSLLTRAYNAERFDGSRWRIYNTPNAVIWLTRAGRQLLAGDPKLHGYFQEYIEALEENDHTPEGPRPFFARGSQSRIFTLGDQPLLVKEANENGDLLIPSLERMDRLVDAVERNCPRWIDVPHHYGVIMLKTDLTKQFMLMEKIDAGVTVKDVLEVDQPPLRSDTGFLASGAVESFGPITPDLQKEVRDKFKEMGGLLRKALVGNRLSPDEYLPDFDHNQDNVVLERLSIPEAGSQIKYWIIDQ